MDTITSDQGNVYEIVKGYLPNEYVLQKSSQSSEVQEESKPCSESEKQDFGDYGMLEKVFKDLLHNYKNTSGCETQFIAEKHKIYEKDLLDRLMNKHNFGKKLIQFTNNNISGDIGHIKLLETFLSSNGYL